MTITAGPTQDQLDAARLQLDVAVAQLLQPDVQDLDRVHQLDDPDVADVDDRAARHEAGLQRSYRQLLAQAAEHRRADRHTAHAAARAMARRILQRLIDHRVREQQRRVRRAELPCLLDQLLDAVQSTQGGGGASAGVHRSPIGLAAAELIGQIERSVRSVGPVPVRLRDHPGPVPLADQLRRWASYAGTWQTRNPDRLLQEAAAATRWVESARSIITPARTPHVAGACPECGTAVVLVDGGSGEPVRRPALQLDPNDHSARCTAPRCGATWSHDRLPLLARVLEQQAAAHRLKLAAVRRAQRGNLTTQQSEPDHPRCQD